MEGKNFRRPDIKVEFCLRVVDTLWSCFIVTPLVIFYWSGTWKLVDSYILPDKELDKPSLLSSYVSLGIGTAIGITGYLILPLLSEHINPQWTTKHVIVSRLFSYVYAFGTLNFWRGIWNLMDHFVGTGLTQSLICYAVAKLILIVLRSASSCLSSPFLVTKDHRDDFYRAYTRFRSEPTTICRYVLDSVLSHVGVTHLSVQVWRALWNTFKHVIVLPDNSLLKSYVLCLGAGYAFCLLLFILQNPLYLLARKLRPVHWILEHMLEVIIKIVATLVCVLLWRGGWGLCRDFLLKDEWHFWIAHSVGMSLLLIVQASPTIGIPSVAVDCEFGWGTGQFYPVDFFLHWYYKTWFQNLSVQTHEDNDSRNSGEDNEDEDLLVG